MAKPKIKFSKQDRGIETDDNENKGGSGKVRRQGRRATRRMNKESAKQETKNLLTENPVVNKSLSTGPTPKALVSKPALKSPGMKAMPPKPRSTDRNEMHATDFDRVSIDKNPSIKVITDEIQNISMMDDNYNTGNKGKGPNPMLKKKSN